MSKLITYFVQGEIQSDGKATPTVAIPETPAVYKLDGLAKAVDSLGPGNTVNDAEMATPDPKEEETLLKSPSPTSTKAMEMKAVVVKQPPIKVSLPLRLGLTLNTKKVSNLEALQPTVSLSRLTLQKAEELAAGVKGHKMGPIVTEVKHVEGATRVEPGVFRIPKFKEPQGSDNKAREQGYISQRGLGPAVTNDMKKLCFNCRSLGHHYRRCPEPRRKFCKRCGELNTTLSRCPHCKRKWVLQGPYVAALGRNVRREELLQPEPESSKTQLRRLRRRRAQALKEEAEKERARSDRARVVEQHRRNFEEAQQQHSRGQGPQPPRPKGQLSYPRPQHHNYSRRPQPPRSEGRSFYPRSQEAQPPHRPQQSSRPRPMEQQQRPLNQQSQGGRPAPAVPQERPAFSAAVTRQEPVPGPYYAQVWPDQPMVQNQVYQTPGGVWVQSWPSVAAMQEPQPWQPQQPAWLPALMTQGPDPNVAQQTAVVWHWANQLAHQAETLKNILGSKSGN